MSVRAVVQRQMQRTLCGIDESLPKFVNKFRIELSNLGRLKLDIVNEAGASAEIDRNRRQCFVHRQGKMPITPQTGFVAERFRKRLTESDTGVLDGVMSVHMEIAVTTNRQVDQRVGGKKGEHVIEEAQAGGNFRITGAIEIERQRNLRFRCVPSNRCAACSGYHSLILPQRLTKATRLQQNCSVGDYKQLRPHAGRAQP